MNKRFSVALSTLAACVLAACGSQTVAPVSGGPDAARAGAASSSATRKTIPAKKGGGYYKDDGPGDEIPVNLDDIPDAVPKWEPLHKPALKPYNVLGKDYQPLTSLQPFRQRGLASWYGKKFHGQKTSNGEIYDMFGMTAAHTTLPIPSYVKVTHLSSGRSVVVRVNDRGPFHAGRIIDLSYTAAHKLGYIGNGSSEVDIEVIIPGTSYASTGVPPTRPVSLPPVVAQVPDTSIDQTFPAGVYLQFGAFANRDNADNLRNHLSQEMEWSSQPIRIASVSNLHKLQMGPFTTRAQAEEAAQRVQREFGNKPFFVFR
ncbi:MAG: lipoprotein [Pseudomonadota bacterium]|jgi:rare lipoprotein A